MTLFLRIMSQNVSLNLLSRDDLSHLLAVNKSEKVFSMTDKLIEKYLRGIYLEILKMDLSNHFKHLFVIIKIAALSKAFIMRKNDISHVRSKCHLTSSSCRLS